MIIGLTGRAGSGKSTAASILLDLVELTLIDLDRIGHLLLTESQVIQSITEAFGRDILNDEGFVKRPFLRKRVLSEPSQLIVLNGIIHPLIKQRTLEQIENAITPHVLIEGALLEEIGLLMVCDNIIVVDASDRDIKQYAPDNYCFTQYQKSRAVYKSYGDFLLVNRYDPHQLFSDCKDVVSTLLER